MAYNQRFNSINLASDDTVVTSDDVTNESTVTGTTVTDALNELDVESVEVWNDATEVPGKLKIWTGSVLTDASGNFTADISPAGISTILGVSAIVIRNTDVNIEIPFCQVATITTSVVTGSVATGINLLAAPGDTVDKVTNGITVSIIVLGV